MVWWLPYRIDSWASISEIVLFDIKWRHVLDALTLISSEHGATGPGDGVKLFGYLDRTGINDEWSFISTPQSSRMVLHYM